MSTAATARRDVHLVILIRSFGFPHGMAAANRVGLLSRALAEQGLKVRVLCLRVSEDPGAVRNSDARGTWEGIPFSYAPGTTTRPDSFAARRLSEATGYAVTTAELLRLRLAGRLDCVLFADNVRHWYPTQWYLRRYLDVLGVPVVIQLNEAPGPIGWPPRPLRTAFSHLSGATGVVAISDWLRSWARREAARIGRRIAVTEVPIVVDTDEQQVTPYPPDAHTLVYSASSDYVIDARYIMRVMRLVWKSRPECRIAITGMDPKRVRQIAETEGVEAELAGGRLMPRGYLSRDELLVQYREAAALLVPLRNDVLSRARFPTKIGEYLSSGRPIVTTDIGEITRYLHDGETAFVSPFVDAPDYAAKICEALADPERAATIGEAGRGVAQTAFDYRRFGPQLKRFFTDVCAMREGRR